jgi:putative membrane protein
MTNHESARRLLPLISLMITLAGCQGSSGARDRSAAATADSLRDTSASKSAAQAPAPRGLSDSNIVYLLDEANKADSAAGAIALKKAARADVKAFARLMMSDHHALRQAGQQLAKQLKISPAPPEHDPIAGYTRNEAASLQKTPKGAQFDGTYIDHEVAVHQAVLDFANMARVTTKTPQLKELIEKAVPTIRKHLEQATAIQKQISPAT